MIKKLLFGLIMLSVADAQASNNKPQARKVKARSLSSLMFPAVPIILIPGPGTILGLTASLGIDTKNPVFPSDSYKTYYKKMYPKLIKRLTVTATLLSSLVLGVYGDVMGEFTDHKAALTLILCIGGAIGGTISGAIVGTVWGIPSIPLYAFADKWINKNTNFEIDSDEPEQTQSPATA